MAASHPSAHALGADPVDATHDLIEYLSGLEGLTSASDPDIPMELTSNQFYALVHTARLYAIRVSRALDAPLPVPTPDLGD